MNRFLLLFGGIWLLVGVPFAIVGIWVYTTEREFERSAVVARGVVLSKDISQSRDRNGSTSTSYSVHYRFTPRGGRTMEGRGGVDHDVWDRLVEREPVDIEYLPGDPSSNRVRGESKMLLAWIFGGLGSLFTIAGGIIFGIGVRGSLRGRRLRETGMTADATITRVQMTNVRVNRRPQARVVYEFHDDRGERRTGKGPYMSVEEAQRWKAGDRITIKYDRDRPQHSIWEPAPV
jgi:hypothetical protein